MASCVLAAEAIGFGALRPQFLAPLVLGTGLLWFAASRFRKATA